MVLIITPALDGLKREWREAAAILGATQLAVLALWSRCRCCGRASSARSLLLFANAFGAVATAYALTGSLAQHRPILLYAQIRGDVLHNPNLGYALALGMIVITGLANVAYIWLRAAQRAVAADEARTALAPGSPSSLGALYFFVPLIAHVRVLAAHAARRLFSFDAYRVVLGRPALPGDLRLFDGRWRSPPSSSACCSSCRPPTGSGCACRGCGRSSSSSRCCRWSSRRSSSSSAISASTISSSWLPLTGSARGTDLLLIFGYVDAGAALHVPRRRHRPARHRRADPDRGGAEPRRRLADDHAPGDPAQCAGRGAVAAPS